MKYKIGVFGSSAGDMDKVMPKAKELGKAFHKFNDQIILVNGACAGLPYIVAKKAKEGGVEIWGFSSSVDEKKQRGEYSDDDLSMYSKITYVPADFPGIDNDRYCKKYRNVVATSSCDAGIIISGRWGSLNEFTNLVDFQKIVGVLTGTGGIADELPELAKKISKSGQGKIIFESNPEKLIRKIIEELKTP